MKKRSTLRKIVNLSPLVDVLMIVIFWYIMISDRNLESEKMAARAVLAEQQNSYEATIDSLEQTLANSEEELAKANAYIEELLKELENQHKEKGELGEENVVLTTENEKLQALLEQEGQFFVLQLLSGTGALRTLELTYEADTDRITFNNDERGALAENLRNLMLEHLQEGKRVSVIFLYTGDNAFSRDVSVVNDTMLALQKEYYFVYSKMNLSR